MVVRERIVEIAQVAGIGDLDVFDMAGKRVGLLRNVRGTVDLRVIGATASNSYIVRIRPAVRGEMP